MSNPTSRTWYVISVLFVTGVMFVLILVSVKPTTSQVLIVSPSPEAQSSPTPARAATASSVRGNAANGEKLFQTFQPVAGISCSACHRVDSEERLVGPGLLNIGIRAANRVPGKSAEAYIRESIVDPSAYVVSDYQDIMPKNWGKVFTPAQLDDLVAYLMKLR